LTRLTEDQLSDPNCTLNALSPINRGQPVEYGSTDGRAMDLAVDQSGASPFQIHPVESEVVREKVFRLRYEILSAEGGDHRYANHERRLSWDSLDATTATQVGAYCDDQLIGAARLSSRRSQPFCLTTLTSGTRWRTDSASPSQCS